MPEFHNLNRFGPTWSAVHPWKHHPSLPKDPDYFVCVSFMHNSGLNNRSAGHRPVERFSLSSYNPISLWVFCYPGITAPYFVRPT